MKSFYLSCLSLLLCLFSIASPAGEIMEPKIVEISDLKIEGIQTTGNPAQGDFGKTWPILFERCDEISDKVGPRVSYGVQSYDKSLMKKGVWRYTAGFEVESEDNIPEGMILIELPSTKYAVFEYQGVIGPELGRTFEYIYTEWLPASEFEGAAPYDYEKYDERFKGPDNPDSVLEIYIPIKEKRT